MASKNITSVVQLIYMAANYEMDFFAEMYVYELIQ